MVYTAYTMYTLCMKPLSSYYSIQQLLCKLWVFYVVFHTGETHTYCASRHLLFVVFPTRSVVRFSVPLLFRSSLLHYSAICWCWCCCVNTHHYYFYYALWRCVNQIWKVWMTQHSNPFAPMLYQYWQPPSESIAHHWLRCIPTTLTPWFLYWENIQILTGNNLKRSPPASPLLLQKRQTHTFGHNGEYYRFFI